MLVFGVWEEAGVRGDDPHRHRENKLLTGRSQSAGGLKPRTELL